MATRKEPHRSSRSLKSSSRHVIVAARLTCQSPNSPLCGLASVTLRGTSASCAHRIHQLLLMGSGTRQVWYAIESQYVSSSQLFGEALSTSVSRSCRARPSPPMDPNECAHSSRLASSDATYASGSGSEERRASSRRRGLSDLRYFASESDSLGTGSLGRVSW